MIKEWHVMKWIGRAIPSMGDERCYFFPLEEKSPDWWRGVVVVEHQHLPEYGYPAEILQVSNNQRVVINDSTIFKGKIYEVWQDHMASQWLEQHSRLQVLVLAGDLSVFEQLNDLPYCLTSWPGLGGVNLRGNLYLKIDGQLCRIMGFFHNAED